MNNRSRTTLFLMEQLVVIIVFAACAAICVNILASSFIMASRSQDMRNALLIAKNGAECYKAAGGDVVKSAALLSESARIDDECVTVYYDKKSQSCYEDEGVYILRLTKPNSAIGLVSLSSVSVETIAGEEIISLTVAARGLQSGERRKD